MQLNKLFLIFLRSQCFEDELAWLQHPQRRHQIQFVIFGFKQLSGCLDACVLRTMTDLFSGLCSAPHTLKCAHMALHLADPSLESVSLDHCHPSTHAGGIFIDHTGDTNTTGSSTQLRRQQFSPKVDE